VIAEASDAVAAEELCARIEREAAEA
jgi:hypothetical protein